MANSLEHLMAVKRFQQFGEGLPKEMEMVIESEPLIDNRMLVEKYLRVTEELVTAIEDLDPREVDEPLISQINNLLHVRITLLTFFYRKLRS